MDGKRRFVLLCVVENLPDPQNFQIVLENHKGFKLIIFCQIPVDTLRKKNVLHCEFDDYACKFYLNQPINLTGFATSER